MENYYVRFAWVGSKRVALFQCRDFQEDGSFITHCGISKSDNEFFKAVSSKEWGYNAWKIYPKVSYEIFEQIEKSNPHEANFLVIDYYGGTDSKNIIKHIEGTTFIIDDKIPVEYRVPTEKYPNGSAEKAKGRINDILKYKGLDHVQKPLDQIEYKGDCYSKIELLPDCRYRLFKLMAVVEKKIKINLVG